MPGVASQLRERPLRVHWLWASVTLSSLLITGVGFSEDDDSSRDGSARRSRKLLVDPEKIAPEEIAPEGTEKSSSGLVDDTETELSADDFLNETVVDVIIEGHETIADYAIQKYLKVKKGRTVTPQEIQEDVAALRKTHWFSSVRPIYRRTKSGLILVYEVRERPITREVRFIGNKKIKTAELEAHTGLRVNQPFDVALHREAVARVRSLYLEKGYRNADVQLTKGGNPKDREVVMTITEGPKTRVYTTSFEGNAFDTDAVLRTKLATKRALFRTFSGIYDPQLIENDVITLSQYYENLGFFDVKVTQTVDITENQKGANVVFTIDEGQRYRVRNVDLIGYEVVDKKKLYHKPKLKAGDYFSRRFMQNDLAKMKEQYDVLGRLYAKIEPTPIFLDEPGIIDLEYRIDEDKPYLVGDIKVNFRGDQPHTREDVILNTVARMVKPGQLADGRKIDLARRRIVGSQLWDQSDAPTFEIVPVDGRDYMLASDDPLSDIMRGQEFESEFTQKLHAARSPQPTAESKQGDTNPRRHVARPASKAAPKVAVPSLNTESNTPPPATPTTPKSTPGGTSQVVPRRGPLSIDQAVAHHPQSPPDNELSTLAKARAKANSGSVEPGLYNVDPSSLFGEAIEPDIVIRGQSDDMTTRGQSIDRNGVPVPQDFGSGTSNSGNPYGGSTFGRNRQPPGFVDLDIDVTEGRTGRLMFGAGVNSNNGIVGNAVLQEDNFDIMRPPRSWADIVNGYAWRGAGQSFRLEAQPGNQVSRYVASWNDPFFMRTDYNLGVSGFYFNRFYNEWTEDRLGGRISVGRLINEYWSGSVALRLEDVGIRNIPVGAPTDLTSVAGSNFLSTVGFTLSNDTRDNAFIPSQGHFFEGQFEQAFGQFTYSRVETSASQYFTVRERADGFGKHIVQLYGSVAWTGSDTPIFERYYAGGYSSFRGFAFRGVSPVKSGTRVGGNFMALGTAEYMLPLTANDQIRAVAFTDFGTVQQDVGFEDFRVSAGLGFRLVIPAMGPAPIAFDFAWPLHDQKTDTRRMFSFYVGFTR